MAARDRDRRVARPIETGCPTGDALPKAAAVPGRTDEDDRRLRSAQLAGHDAPNSAEEVRCGARRCRSDAARRDFRAANPFASALSYVAFLRRWSRSRDVADRSAHHRRGTCRATPAEALQAADQHAAHPTRSHQNPSCDPPEGRIAADVRSLMGVGRTA